MNELKAKHVVDVYDEYSANPVNEAQVYLKSEADEYIGELKKERDWLSKDRAQAYDDLEKRAQLNIKQEESIRHQKYKRCLVMAMWCVRRLCFMEKLSLKCLMWIFQTIVGKKFFVVYATTKSGTSVG